MQGFILRQYLSETQAWGGYTACEPATTVYRAFMVVPSSRRFLNQGEGVTRVSESTVLVFTLFYRWDHILLGRRLDAGSDETPMDALSGASPGQLSNQRSRGSLL